VVEGRRKPTFTDAGWPAPGSSSEISTGAFHQGRLVVRFALTVGGSPIRLYNARGKAWSEKQEYDKAIADFGEAIRTDPKQVVPYFLRGQAWSEKREWDKAIADYNESIRLYPIIAGDSSQNVAVAGIYNRRGTAWLNKRDYDKAISDYNEAILLDPKSEAAKRNLQRALEAKRK
jgi:tetratricopeptide (TPR) repeat protein